MYDIWLYLIYLLILYNVELLHLKPVKSESRFQRAAQQPDVEAGQWIELNMLEFLCSVVSGKKGSSLR